MAKDPAFLFYPSDWLGGTLVLSHLEKGCYIDLLMLQFNNGKFTEAQAKHMLGDSFDLVWQNLKNKFTFKNGFYHNIKLAQEISKRKKFTESRRNNALRNKNKPKTKKAYAKDMQQHIENENENENIYNNLDNKPSISTNSIEQKKENEKSKQMVLEPEDIEVFKAELYNAQIWKEGACKSLSCTEQEFRRILDKFGEHCISDCIEKKDSITQVKKHFMNWARIYIKNNPSRGFKHA